MESKPAEYCAISLLSQGAQCGNSYALYPAGFTYEASLT